ncbi:MAG: tyrosine-type recombinase/integrase [Bacilli bacterium]|nr:tyrosine-type recombinase/integrase [Bacilli bacterium]
MSKVTKITPHGIRHSNATWLLNNPNLTMMEIGMISERLGHESKKVTLDIYYHLTKNKDNKNILSALL